MKALLEESETHLQRAIELRPDLTLMKITATLLEPDAGGVDFDGLDIVNDKIAARRLLGYVPQEFGSGGSWWASRASR